MSTGVDEMALVEIEDPTDFDVLCGRGGASLKHPGNLMYRRLVHMNKAYYITSVKTEKLKISRSIVAAVREQSGRFLERDGIKGTWYDIGDKKAIEKTSQALREGQPKLRQHMVEMGAGHPGLGLEFKTVPTASATSNYNPTMVIQQQMAQQQMAQQQLLTQQRIIQQKMAQQQFAQQQLARQQIMMQQQMSAQQQGRAAIPPPPPAMQQVGQGRALHNIMLDQLNISSDERDGLATNVLPHPAAHLSNHITSPGTLGSNPDNDSMQPDPAEVPQHRSGVIGRLDENKGQEHLYAPYPASEGLSSTLSDTANRPEQNQIHEFHQEVHKHSGALLFGQDQTQGQEGNLNDSPPFTDKQHSFQARSHPMGLGAPPTDPNSISARKLDRRHIFAKMKYSRPASGRLTCNRSNGSFGADDGMPDVQMMGSTFSLLSNLSSNQDMKMENLTALDQKLRDDYQMLGSRRSLMSGLSRISGSSDALSMFSDLSRKIGNISTQSIAMSEVSGIEEGNQEDLDESFHIDPMAIANAAHMQFDS